MAKINEYKTDLQDKINSNRGVCSVLNWLGISSAKTIEIIFSQIELKDLKIMCLFILYNLDKDNGQYDNLLQKNNYTGEQIKETAKETLEKLIVLAKKDKSIAELYRKTINLKENRKPKNELIDSILKIKKIELNNEEKEKMEKCFSATELEILIIYFSLPDYQISIGQIKKIYFVDEKYINTTISKLNSAGKKIKANNEPNIKANNEPNIKANNEPNKKVKKEVLMQPKVSFNDMNFEEQLAKLFSIYGNVDFDNQQLRKIIDFVSEKDLKTLIDFYYFNGSKEEMLEKYNMSEGNLAKNIRSTLILVKECTAINLPSNGKFKFYCYNYKNEASVKPTEELENSITSPKIDLERHMKKAEIICSIYGINNPDLIEKARLKFNDTQVNVFLLFSELNGALTDEEISIAENFSGNPLTLVKTMKKEIGKLAAEDLDIKSRIIFSLTPLEKATIIELIKETEDLEKTLIFSLILKLSDRKDVYYLNIAKILNINEQETRKILREAFNEMYEITTAKEQGKPSELNLINTH